MKQFKSKKFRYRYLQLLQKIEKETAFDSKFEKEIIKSSVSLL